VSCRVLHCCSVDPGLLKVRLPPGSDGMVDDPADPGCANSGPLLPYDLFANALLLFERGVHDRVVEPFRCVVLDDPRLPRLFPESAFAKLHEEATG
jgi:hypothetical protein